MLPNIEGTATSYSFTAPTVNSMGLLTVNVSFTNTGSAFITGNTEVNILTLIWDEFPGYPSGDLSAYGDLGPGVSAPIGLPMTNGSFFGMDVNQTVSLQTDISIFANQTTTSYITIHADPFGQTQGSADYYEGLITETNEWDNIAVTFKVETAPGFTAVSVLADDVWQTGWNVGWYYGWGTGWHVGWYSGWGFGWNLGWYLDGTTWAYGWNTGWHVGWHVGWNVGWYVGWHYGWNSGWHQSWGWVAL
ncbi:MAG: hypothetical protein AAGK33_01790 [Pseudomonadota bacterium]